MNYLDCQGCKLPREVRRMWHCGLVPAVEWVSAVGSYPRAHDVEGTFDAAADEADVCPGYLLSLPAVAEVTRAYLHWDKGHDLSQRYDGEEPTGVLLDAIEVLSGAVAEQQSYVIDKAREG